MSIDLDDVPAEFRPAILATLEMVGVKAGHLGVEAVTAERIQELNRRFRDRDQPTDVLSFPVDEDDTGPGPRELGDVLFCPRYCSNPTEAVVHGVLHLCGHDHESDGGEMLDLQNRIVVELGLQPSMTMDAGPDEPDTGPGEPDVETGEMDAASGKVE